MSGAFPVTTSGAHQYLPMLTRESTLSCITGEHGLPIKGAWHKSISKVSTPDAPHAHTVLTRTQSTGTFTSHRVVRRCPMVRSVLHAPPIESTTGCYVFLLRTANTCTAFACSERIMFHDRVAWPYRGAELNEPQVCP